MSTTTTPTPTPQRMGIDPSGRAWSDGSALDDWARCPRRWFIKHVLHRTGAGRSAALDYGSAWHELMELHHKGGKPLTQVQLLAIGTKYNLLEVEDHRNYAMLCTSYERWQQEFPVQYPAYLHNGKPVIEGPFALPLTDEIMWCGKIDRLISIDRVTIAVEDHKTSSADSGRFWSAFEADPAQTGYCWAATQVSQTTVCAFVINAHFTLKSGPKFKQRVFLRDYRIFTEWKEMIVRAVDQMRTVSKLDANHVLTHGAYANRYACYSHKYGACPFVSVCNMPDTAARQSMLNGLDFTEHTWSPLTQAAEGE